MLSVTKFEPKRNISEVRVHASALFGRTGSIAKCSRCSTKFSRSFDHHGKTEKELLKIVTVSKNEKKSEHPPRPVRKIDEDVFDYACEGAYVKIANVKSVT